MRINSYFCDKLRKDVETTMNKIGIVVKREFSYRVRKRSFILLTILMPFLMAAVIAVPVALSTLKSGEQQNVVIVDRTGMYAPLFKSDENFKFESVGSMSAKYRDKESGVYAVISIWDDLSKDASAVRIYSRKEISGDLEGKVSEVLGRKVREQRLASYNIPGLENIIEKCGEELKVQTVKWIDDGSERQSSTDAAVAVGMFFTLLIYMFVMVYGGMVMQSVTEEKSNRIVELMVSSVKPFTMMMGKVVGVALVGLLQMAIWGVMLFVILGIASTMAGLPDMSQAMMPGSAAMTAPQVPEGDAAQILAAINGMNFGEIGVMFVVYFIGGYLLYASFFAGVGSAINSAEDTSQFMAPTIIIMVFALYAGMFGINNPDGPLAFWCSLIPLTSPIVMMVRLPFGVPLWQEIVSVVLLYATAILMIWIAGRIYRVGILMYGKKPSFRELAKWITYK